MDISIKEIECTTIDENGKIVWKDKFENIFEKLDEFLRNFSEGDRFVMESTGFYEPLYDFIESKGFDVKLANPLKIKLIAESRMKNDDVDSEILAKLLRNDWIPESYVSGKEIRRTMTTYKNRIKIEMKRLHTDYGRDPFTIEGKAFLRSLKSPRCYGSGYVQTTRGRRNTYIEGESRGVRTYLLFRNEVRRY